MINVKDNEHMRTPFVRQQSGGMSIFLIEGKQIEWGHRFDTGIGYRVYIRFQDSINANVFLPDQAIKAAKSISKDEDNLDILKIGAVLVKMATQAAKLNQAWADAGMPDNPLDQVEGAGHA